MMQLVPSSNFTITTPHRAVMLSAVPTCWDAGCNVGAEELNGFQPISIIVLLHPIRPGESFYLGAEG